MYYLSQACCVCFESREKLNSLNNEVNQLLVQKFQYCIGDVEPDVPLFICNTCCPSLNSAYEFKKSCTMNIARLRSYVSQLVQYKSSTETVLHGENDRIVYSDIQVHITRCSPTFNLSSKHLEPTFVEVQSIKTETELDPDLNNSVSVENEIDLSEGLSEIVKEEHSIMPIESVFLVSDAVPCEEKIILNDSSDDVNMVEASNIHHTPTGSCSQSTEELGTRKSDKTCEATKEKRRISKKAKEKSNTSYSCDICSKQFTEKIIWLAHVQCHNDPPYSCTECGKEFISKVYFSRHVTVHSKKQTLYKCTECPKQYNRSFTLKVHFTRTHETECSKCNKVFKSNEEFQLHHTKEHFKELYFKCEMCDKVLTRLRNYQVHMRSHKEGTPFQCKHCPEAFQNNYRLKQHMALEHNIGRLKCNNCCKSFSDKSVFDAHVKAHETESPHVCSQCGKTFKREKEFKVHVKKHNVENCYKCKQCGNFYLKFSTYKNHMATHS